MAVIANGPLWEERVGGSNPSAATINHLAHSRISSKVHFSRLFFDEKSARVS